MSNERSPLIVKSNEFSTETKITGRRTAVTSVTLVIFAIVSGWLLFQKAAPLVLNQKSDTVSVNEKHEAPVDNDDSSFHVQSGKPGFLTYHENSAINVTYDKRSLLLNGERSLFLGGSLHPARATPGTWEDALDQAVQNNLNLITIYVFWSAHQPFAESPLDWRFQISGGSNSTHHNEFPDWELADAIRSCARRGFFVHIRVGPYDCAEYSYGGIPEWLPRPGMRMRRLDPAWMAAMEDFVSKAFDYLSQNSLWAPQGGPIIMAQIENELGDETGAFMTSSGSKNSSRRSETVQDYADWCGTMAAKYTPAEVALTMCNGLTANNTILTYNGDGGSAGWLERHGDTGRIQVDQPALWTEDEGGFQLWGEDSAHPTDYFWGHTARRMAADALKWFARGGSHLNYYMWWGGYNRGRSAAAGIMNAYASDAVLCPSGEPRQPKFDHFKALHATIVDIADLLLQSSSALGQRHTIELLVVDEEGVERWEPSTKHAMFVYHNAERQAIFVESNSNEPSTVKFHATHADEWILEVQPFAAILLVDGTLVFDSATIDPLAMSYERKRIVEPAPLVNWTTWNEPVGRAEKSPATVIAGHPLEQTHLVVSQSVSSDYAWYETNFCLLEDFGTPFLLEIATQKANGIVAYVDGAYVGATDNHEHGEGSIILNISVPKPLDMGCHKLSLLSESLGYHNLIGRWVENTGPKTKGITGGVRLSSPQRSRALQLVDGRPWASHAGLFSESGNIRAEPALSNPSNRHSVEASPVWWSTSFETPMIAAGSHLFIEISLGRGHIWLNGHDLGRYWNITRGATNVLSMENYLLPHDYLYDDGRKNELVLFSIFGDDLSGTRLLLSWISKCETPTFLDEVDFPQACF